MPKEATGVKSCSGAQQHRLLQAHSNKRSCCLKKKPAKQNNPNNTQIVLPIPPAIVSPVIIFTASFPNNDFAFLPVPVCVLFRSAGGCGSCGGDADARQPCRRGREVLLAQRRPRLLQAALGSYHRTWSLLHKRPRGSRIDSIYTMLVHGTSSQNQTALSIKVLPGNDKQTVQNPVLGWNNFLGSIISKREARPCRRQCPVANCRVDAGKNINTMVKQESDTGCKSRTAKVVTFCVTQITVINRRGSGHSTDSSKVQELFSQIRALVMEVPCFLQKEQGCNENNQCAKAIKDACLVQLTKQGPPGHRSFWFASQKQAEA